MKRNVLVVDDDASIRGVLHDILALHGYQVEEAVNGHDALEKLSSFTPSLIFLDLMMPTMDGIAFAQELRNRNLSYALVAISASGTTHAFAEQIHAIGYVEKPFHISQLLNVISRWMSESQT